MSKPAPWLLAALIAGGCAATAPATAPPAPPPPPPSPTTAPNRTTGTGDTTTGARAPARITASAAKLLLITDVKVDPNRPRLPDRLNKPGARYLGMYKICVSSGGNVTAVTVDKGTGDPGLDADWMKTLRGWRYRPLEMSGRKVPFCYTSPVEVSAG
jgi:TonB family protein